MIKTRQCLAEEVADLQKLNDGVFVDNSKYDPDIDLDWAKGEKGKKYFTDLLNRKEAFCLIAELTHHPKTL